MDHAPYAIALCVLLAAGGAKAMTLNVALYGTCVSECSSLTLADGDKITGTIAVDPGFYSEDGFSGNEALKSYDFTFGNFSVTSANMPDPRVSIGWGNAPDQISASVSMPFCRTTRLNPARCSSLARMPTFRVAA